MVKHNNMSIPERLLRIFKWKGGENMENEVSPFIQPVISVEPYTNIIATGGNAATAAVTVYTTPTDRDFFLHSIHLSYEKNATADNTEVYVSVTLANKLTAVNLIDIATLSLTASRDTQVIVFPKPLLLARGTGIGLYGTFSVGALIKTAQITGFTEELG